MTHKIEQINDMLYELDQLGHDVVDMPSGDKKAELMTKVINAKIRLIRAEEQVIKRLPVTEILDEISIEISKIINLLKRR